MIFQTQRPEQKMGFMERLQTFRYRLAEQSGPAPLIFIIAGTGAHYSNSTMEYLKKLGGF